MEEIAKKKSFFSELKKDRLLLSLILIILAFGVYSRFSNYSQEGLWSDDMANIPAGLLWFYPSPYFPALSSGNFPLGNFFIGAGCMLSGQDFSQVVNVQPMFYPGREIMIGKSLVKAEQYCHLPMYIFGIIFFFLIAILAFLVLDKYSAVFVTAFFAFHPYLLLMSRWIRGDIIFWSFLVASLIFLWRAYNHEKCSKKEILFFVVGFAFLGLAHATKETTPLFFVFALIILFSKYSSEFFHYIKLLLRSIELKFIEKLDDSSVNLKFFHKTIIYSAISYIFFFLIIFKFNPKNVYDTYNMYSMFNSQMSSISFSLLGIFKYFYSFFLRVNVFDSILLVVAIFIFIAFIFRKNKSKSDKFLLYFSVVGMVLSFFFWIMEIDRIAFPFLLLFVFFMGISLSKILKSVFKSKARLFFFVFMVAYTSFSFFIALSTSPYFAYTNDVACFFNGEMCNELLVSNLGGLSSKDVASYISQKLKDGETFYGVGMTTYFYVKRQQHLMNWQFDSAFKQQTGKEPDIFDRVKYFHPDNETIRYLFVTPYDRNFFAGSDFQSRYIYNDVFRMKGIDVFYVYDLQSLKEKS